MPILSICIPTYNRAFSLDLCLSAIFAEDFNSDLLEVIVADNCSTDNTDKIVAKYGQNENLQYFRNNKNVGPVANILNLIYIRAKGKYCWVIGDDDIIHIGSIRIILNELVNRDVDFIRINKDHIKHEELLSLSSSGIPYSKTIEKEIGTLRFGYLWQFLLPPYTNIFLGEIMCNVFDRDIFVENELFKEIGTNNLYLTNFKNSFPHCYVFASEFLNCRAIYIENPLITVIDDNRDWWSKSAFLLIGPTMEMVKFYTSRIPQKDLRLQLRTQYFSISFKSFLLFFGVKNIKNLPLKTILSYVVFSLIHVRSLLIFLINRTRYNAVFARES